MNYLNPTSTQPHEINPATLNLGQQNLPQNNLVILANDVNGLASQNFSIFTQIGAAPSLPSLNPMTMQFLYPNPLFVSSPPAFIGARPQFPYLHYSSFPPAHLGLNQTYASPIVQRSLPQVPVNALNHSSNLGPRDSQSPGASLVAPSFPSQPTGPLIQPSNLNPRDSQSPGASLVAHSFPVQPTDRLNLRSNLVPHNFQSPSAVGLTAHPSTSDVESVASSDSSESDSETTSVLAKPSRAHQKRQSLLDGDEEVRNEKTRQHKLLSVYKENYPLLLLPKKVNPSKTAISYRLEGNRTVFSRKSLSDLYQIRCKDSLPVLNKYLQESSECYSEFKGKLLAILAEKSDNIDSLKNRKVYAPIRKGSKENLREEEKIKIGEYKKIWREEVEDKFGQLFKEFKEEFTEKGFSKFTTYVRIIRPSYGFQVSLRGYKGKIKFSTSFSGKVIKEIFKEMDAKFFEKLNEFNAELNKSGEAHKVNLKSDLFKIRRHAANPKKKAG